MAAVLVTACDEAPAGASSLPEAGSADAARPPLDAAALHDVAPAGDAGAPDSAELDGAPDAALALDAAAPPAIETCAAACDRFATCERLAERFGDEDACLRACARASREAPPATWFACLAREGCGLIHRCRLPEPPPLTCAESCDALADCGVAWPAADCTADCEASPTRGERSACAEGLAGGVCDVAGFWGCVGERVYPDCGVLCERARACNLAVPEDCVAACAADLEQPDALGRLRAAQCGECVGVADDRCDRVNECLHPTPGGQRPPIDLATFCGLLAVCNGADIVPIPCDDLYRVLTDAGGAVAVSCAAVVLEGGCNLDAVFACTEVGPTPPGASCAELCEAMEVCDRLDGQPAIECIRACGEGLEMPEVERAAARVACGSAGDCAALGGCLGEADPEVACPAWCGARAACGLMEDEALCAELCGAAFFFDRQRAARACVAEAGGDCPRIAACEPPPEIPCEDACARRAACELLPPGGRCTRTCDDAHFADPVAAAQEVACVRGALACHGPGRSMEACDFEPERGGADCMNYCRALSECPAAPDRTLVECMNACAARLPPTDALRMFGARDCLRDTGPDAPCEALRGCSLPREPRVPCPEVCELVDACHVPWPGDADSCAEGCRAAPDNAPAGCVIEAWRTGEGCAGIAVCLRYDPPPESEGCARLCAARKSCNPRFDAWLCARRCTPEPPDLVTRLACAEISRCDELDACLELGPEVLDACRAPCDAAGRCGAFETPEICARLCTGRQASPATPATYLDELSACVADVTARAPCDAAAARACFTPPPNRCGSVCERLVACPDLDMPDLAECLDGCQAAAEADPAANARLVDCLLDALAGGACDAGRLDACVEQVAGGRAAAGSTAPE